MSTNSTTHNTVLSTALEAVIEKARKLDQELFLIQSSGNTCILSKLYPSDYFFNQFSHVFGIEFPDPDDESLSKEVSSLFHLFGCDNIDNVPEDLRYEVYKAMTVREWIVIAEKVLQFLKESQDS